MARPTKYSEEVGKKILSKMVKYEGPVVLETPRPMTSKGLTPMPSKRTSRTDRQAEFAWMRDLLRASVGREPGDPLEVKLRLLRTVAAEIDAKLATMQPGQGLGIVFRLEVMTPRGNFRDEPSLRYSGEAREWREAIFKRDEYRCRHCGMQSEPRSGNLHAHHIIEWAKDESQRFELDNGLTLCIECHAQQHPDRAHLVRKAGYQPSGVAGVDN